MTSHKLVPTSALSETHSKPHTHTQNTHTHIHTHHIITSTHTHTHTHHIIVHSLAPSPQAAVADGEWLREVEYVQHVADTALPQQPQIGAIVGSAPIADGAANTTYWVKRMLAASPLFRGIRRGLPSPPANTTACDYLLGAFLDGVRVLGDHGADEAERENVRDWAEIGAARVHHGLGDEHDSFFATDCSPSTSRRAEQLARKAVAIRLRSERQKSIV